MRAVYLSPDKRLSRDTRRAAGPGGRARRSPSRSATSRSEYGAAVQEDCA
jgi:hypothetical protein